MLGLVFREDIFVRRCLFLLFCFSLSGCGPKGPEITACTPQVSVQNFSCYNEANGKASVVIPKLVDNWIFTSASDDRSIQTACINGTGWPQITVCSFSASLMQYVCYSEVSKTSFTLSFSNSNGWIGVSAVDEQILLEFCESLVKLKASQH